MEELTKNVETQQPKRDETPASTVKTPLVDALRSYFKLDFDDFDTSKAFEAKRIKEENHRKYFIGEAIA